MTSQKPRLLGPGAVAVTLLCVLAACGSPSSSGSTAPAAGRGDDVVVVAASTDVYGAVVEAIGGELVEVTSFIDDPGADPAAYESTPADALAVGTADLVIGNGGGYDDFLFTMVEASGGQRTVLTVADLAGPPGGAPAGQELNEHFWFDLEVMQRLGDRVADELSVLRPDGADAVRAGAVQFRTQVQRLRDELAVVATEHTGTRVAATEPLPIYLLEDAGLVNATPEEFMEASEEGTDAPAAVVQATLELVTGAEPVSALLLNTQTQTPATDRLREAATKAAVPEVEVYETLSEGSGGYVPWMEAQIDALAEALSR